MTISHKGESLRWMGIIPSHWQVQTLRHMLTPFSEKNHPEMPLLSVVREKGVIIRNVEDKEENHNFVPDDLSNYKLVRRGQFAMNKMKAWQGSYGVSQYDGIVSPAYFVFDINFDINPEFFHRAIRSKAYVNYFAQASDGIRVGQWDLSMPRMKEIPFLIPPRAEQDQIVRFLDWKVSSINRLILLKKKEIRLITESQNTAISELVFGRKRTGKKKTLELLGNIEIPDEWNVYRNKFIFRERTEHTETGSEMLLSVSRHYGVKPYEALEENEQYATIKPALSLVGYKKVYCGDLAMNIMRAQNGSFGISHYNGIVSPAYCVYMPIREFDHMYVHYLYKTAEMIHAFSANSYGIVEHRRRLYPENFLRMITILPPMDVQHDIVMRIEKIISLCNENISTLNKQIEKLQELKTRLVSDAVSGRIDVREIEIPEYEFVTDESDAIDEESDTEEDLEDQED